MANSKTIATMKRLFNIMMFVAVAAMGITACQNEPTEINVSAKKVTIEVIGELDATRSSFGDMVVNGTDKHFPSKWDGGEQVVFSLNEAALVTAENTGTGSKATFSVGLTDDETTEGTIFAFSPKGTFNGSSATDNVGGFTGINKEYQDLYVVVPTEQNPSTTSVDPAAHLLAGKTTYTNGLPEAVKMEFNHAAAYGRMEITNFAEEITKVEITASEALAGSSCWYYYAGAQEGQLTNADKETITINNPAANNKVFWFGCAPADLSEGTLEVKVYTADASYTKEIDFASKDLELGFAFVQGQVANFRVSMSGVAKDDDSSASSDVYTKVTSTADVTDGTYLIVYETSSVAFDGGLTTLDATNNNKSVTITDNTIESNATTDAMAFTITAVSGGYTIQSASGYYIGRDASSNGLNTNKTTQYTNTISINADGSAVIKGKGGAALQFNSDSGQKRFRYYTSTQKPIALYKKGGETGGDEPATTPLTTPEVTATAEGNTITVSWDAVEGAANYTVSCDGFEDKTVTGTSVEYTGLEYSTPYTFEVVANPADADTTHTASAAGNASETTEADPDATPLIADGDYVIIATNAANTLQWALSAEANSTRLNSVDITYAGEDTFETPLTEIIWTIKYVGGKYTMSNGDKYINCKGGNDASTTNDETYVYINESEDETGRYNIVWGEDSDRLLSRNSTTANNYFAFYTGTQQDDLFIVRAEKITVEATTLPAPTGVVASNITESSATITWTAVANATGYSVTYNGTTTSVEENSCELTNLTPNTDYSVTVVAKGDGGVYYNDSAASAACAFKTEAASGGGDVVDVLTASLFTATTTTYTDFSGVTVTSGAVYSGNSAKTSGGAIQLRSSKSSGIVTTTSGGKVRSITVTYASGSNTMDVYGKNTAYSAASDLYSSGTRGTKIGSISGSGTITITGDYEYIGIRSNNGALYITSIEITYEN